MHRILVIDDHALVARGLESIFTAQQDLDVLGCITDPRHVLSEVSRLLPDVVTLDLAMPGIHGSDLISPIQAASPDTRIIILTGLSDLPLLAEVFNKSPHAILQKAGDPDDLLAAVRAQPASTPILCAAYAALFDANEGRLKAITPLSVREREVVQLLAQGNTTKEIADALGISEHTIRKHRENARAKLAAKTTGELVILAARRGYIE